MLLILSSLAVALAALGYCLFADARGWASLNFFATFLVAWLPVLSAMTIALLWSIVSRTELRWPGAAGLIILLGGVQFGLLLIGNSGRGAFAFLPLALIGLCGLAVSKDSPSSAAFVRWANRATPFLVAAGVLAVGGTFGIQAYRHRQRDKWQEAFRVEEARKESSLRGLERAGWLLEREFGLGGEFNHAEFLRTRVYRRPRWGGEYRWDEQKHRLVLTQPLFAESWRRDQILPYAEQALRTQALRPGPRPDLAGGVLECRPPLECTVTWEFDVDRMQPHSPALQPPVSGIEALAWREISSAH